MTDIDSLQKQYRASGDVASADAMTQIGLGVGVHLTEGEGSQLLITQLLGVAIERRLWEAGWLSLAIEPGALLRPVDYVDAGGTSRSLEGAWIGALLGLLYER